MKKKSIRKLALKKLNIRTLDAASGGRAYRSYAYNCSGSCNSCGDAGCEPIGPSKEANLCSHQY